MLLGVGICLVGGAIWLIIQYGSIVQKGLTIRALRKENREMRQKYEKLRRFESEFGKLERRVVKIANALNVQEAAISYPKTSLVPKDSLPDLTSLANMRGRGAGSVDERHREAPSAYPVKGWITQRFSSSHPGVDLAARNGAPVSSTMNGVVEFVGEHSSLGKIVEIVNKKGFKTMYGHLSRSTVAQGEEVKCGTLIGFVGSTGKSSAPHLHYEIRLDGIPHDPERYLEK
jgi:murein DD-endopeptidase MepM/ murein hydrolase activator NlpD